MSDRPNHRPALVALGPWTLRATGAVDEVPSRIRGLSLPATVPGCVHLDLHALALVPDPGSHAEDLRWIGLSDWEYRTQLDITPDSSREYDLVFDGLDTIAEVSLDDQVILNAANEHHPHRIRITSLLQRSHRRHDLRVLLKSPLNYIAAEQRRLGDRPVNGDWDRFVFLRKAACGFGWDWAPRITTLGMSIAPRLESWCNARITIVRPITHRIGDVDWVLRVDVDLERSDRAPTSLSLTAELSGFGTAARARRVLHELGGVSRHSIDIVIESPHLWWPAGYGQQALYDLKVSLEDRASALLLDVWTSKIGFRAVRVESAADHQGAPFTIVVNDQPVFCKGANWIPCDLFPSRIHRDRVEGLVGMAADANMNMLRVWGGGRYEAPEFYEACDRRGILVWQDFMFACGLYPEEPPLAGHVETEARFQLSRLCRHPAVVLWCGGNECCWGYESWEGRGGTWKAQVEKSGLSWGRAYYLDLLPRLVAELSPTTPYWPNSPYTLSSQGPPEGPVAATPEPPLHPNDAAHGDSHVWHVWGDGFRSVVPRFCSEFGQQAPSNLKTLAVAGLVPAPQAAAPCQSSEQLMGELLAARQLGPGGNKRWFDEPLAAWYEPAASFAEWHAQAQELQARSLRIAIEWWRANQPTCMGTLIWQLNESWAGLSWAIIDAANEPKPAYRAVRAAFASRLLTIQPVDDGLWLIAINDSSEPWVGALRLNLSLADGTATSAELQLNGPPWSASRLADLALLSDRKNFEGMGVTAAVGDVLQCWRMRRGCAIPEPIP